MKKRGYLLTIVVILLICSSPVLGFTTLPAFAERTLAFTAATLTGGTTATFTGSATRSPSKLLHYATTPSTSLPASSSSDILQRRKVLLSRTGPYFRVDSSSGDVEFGATVNLMTKLDDESVANSAIVAEWLSDEKRVAKAIWEESLLFSKGNSVYELQLMTLQFVTLQLQPSVTIKMWSSVRPTDGSPVFYLQSVGFEPNLSLLGGGLGKVDAKTLGLEIDVVGQLAPSSSDLGGVKGKITFSTRGVLPIPLRILPEGILQAASDRICQTVADFAIASFQTGARDSYQEFKMSRKYRG